MDQRTRKLMKMHKALHPRDDTIRLYLSRKDGGIRLASIQESLDASIQRLEDYIYKRGGRLIIAIKKYWQHKYQQNRNNQKNKTRKENNSMDKESLTRENLNMFKKGKPFERNRISSDRSTKQRHKNHLYQS